MTSVHIKRGNIWTQTCTPERCQVKKMRAETRVMVLQAEEGQRLVVNHQNLAEKHGTDRFSSTVFKKGPNLANILTS